MHLRAIQRESDEVKKEKRKKLGQETKLLRDSLKRFDKAVTRLIDAEGDNFYWSPEARTTGRIAVDLACQTLGLLQEQFAEELEGDK